MNRSEVSESGDSVPRNAYVELARVTTDFFDLGNQPEENNMAGYGVKQAFQDARLARGHRSEENSCGDCGKPIPASEILCKECRADVVVMSPNGSYRSYALSTK